MMSVVTTGRGDNFRYITNDSLNFISLCVDKKGSHSMLSPLRQTFSKQRVILCAKLMQNTAAM